MHKNSIYLICAVLFNTIILIAGFYFKDIALTILGIALYKITLIGALNGTFNTNK